MLARQLESRLLAKGFMAILSPLMLQANAGAELGSTFFDCDAGAGHFSTMRTELPSSQQTISGTLRSDMVYRHATYVPAAQVRLVTKDGSRWAGIRIQTDMPRKDVLKEGYTLTISIIQQDRAGKFGEEFIGSMEMKNNLQFKIAVSENSVILKAAEIERSLDVDLGTDRRVELSCSTGDFKFNI